MNHPKSMFQLSGIRYSRKKGTLYYETPTQGTSSGIYKDRFLRLSPKAKQLNCLGPTPIVIVVHYKPKRT